MFEQELTKATAGANNLQGVAEAARYFATAVECRLRGTADTATVEKLILSAVQETVTLAAQEQAAAQTIAPNAGIGPPEHDEYHE